MIIVEINNKEYNLPQSWSEVNIEMFEKIMKQASILSTYKSQVLYSLEMFSILCGAPIEDLKEMNRESFDKMGELCDWVNDNIEPSGVDTWTIEGVEYKAVSNLNSLNMGDNISLEMMINESDEANILANILPILIRKTKDVVKEDGTKKKVLADFDADNYSETRELFKKNLNVADVFQLKSFF